MCEGGVKTAVTGTRSQLNGGFQAEKGFNGRAEEFLIMEGKEDGGPQDCGMIW